MTYKENGKCKKCNRKAAFRGYCVEHYEPREEDRLKVELD